MTTLQSARPPAPHALFHLSREQLLHDLYRAYRRARLHKACTADQQEFELNLESELVSLTNELHSRTYHPRPGICFIIRDPKQREVFAAHFRDRVVHHLYYEYTHSLFERTFIADTYSCIDGRGTHFGIHRLEHHIRSVSQNYRRPCYVLKVDVKGYFMHINRERLYQICMETLDKMRSREIGSYAAKPHSPIGGNKPWEAEHDYELVSYLTKIFTLHNPIADSRRRGSAENWRGLPPSKSLFFSPEGCGLPIGNLTSQLFSNVYMNRFDQFCKRQLHCRHYGRYVDDAFVVSEDREWLRSLVPLMRRFLKDELHLQLHPDKVRINSSLLGVAFLGAYLKPWRTYVNSDTARRIRKKVRMLDTELCSPQRLRSAMSSFAGVFSHWKSWQVCEKALCASNPALLRKGYFTKGMKRWHPYRSVWARWIASFKC